MNAIWQENFRQSSEILVTHNKVKKVLFEYPVANLSISYDSISFYWSRKFCQNNVSLDETLFKFKYSVIYIIQGKYYNFSVLIMYLIKLFW